MGGLGKTVLAIALARDHDIRRAFPDGIFWVTLGQEPALIVRQSQLIEALSDTPRALADIQQGKAHLSELLADKTCLLILDDVWQVDHMQAFDVLGPQCSLLITTRDTSLTKALASKNCVGLNLMTVIADPFYPATPPMIPTASRRYSGARWAVVHRIRSTSAPSAWSLVSIDA